MNKPPRFPAVSRGGYCPPLQVEVRSGSPISLVWESIAEACGFEIVIDEFGYDDYVEVDQPFELPPGIVGLSCFMLIHDGYELCFDGFVINDDSFDIMAHTDADILASASFMESIMMLLSDLPGTGLCSVIDLSIPTVVLLQV